MKTVLPILTALIAFATFTPVAMAQDTQTDSKTAQPTTDFPRGGWDGNNLRLSMTHKSKLLTQRGK